MLVEKKGGFEETFDSFKASPYLRLVRPNLLLLDRLDASRYKLLMLRRRHAPVGFALNR